MIDKEIYFKELEEIIGKNKNLDKADFELLYKALTTEDKIVDTGYLADKIVNDLAGTASIEPMISWEFLNTEIGRALLKAKFDLGNDIYFISDLAEMMDCSRQFISKEIKKGNIESKKRGGTIYFMESDVKEYLAKKKKNVLTEKKETAYEEKKEKFITAKLERENDYK